MYCRWDRSVAEEVYTKTKARYLVGMTDLASHGYSSCTKHLGCVQSPLITISLYQTVLDELHLLLRIMDVLIRNLILYMDATDHKNKAHHGEVTHCVQQLEDSIRSCGVSFQIWQNQELGNLFLEVTTSLHFQASTSCRCWKASQ